jgi:hypothetical protein
VRERHSTNMGYVCAFLAGAVSAGVTAVVVNKTAPGLLAGVQEHCHKLMQAGCCETSGSDSASNTCCETASESVACDQDEKSAAEAA